MLGFGDASLRPVVLSYKYEMSSDERKQISILLHGPQDLHEGTDSHHMKSTVIGNQT